MRIAAFHDVDQAGHTQRVGEYCALLARTAGPGRAFVRAIQLQAQLHDVGNIFIPVEILKKKGAPELSRNGRSSAPTPGSGREIIGDHPRLAMARVIALSHHENWDGSGYPNWLKGEQIPLAGRIVALADRYDALRIARPYKPAMDHRAACEMISQGNERIKPEYFDPAVLAAFLELAPRSPRIERCKDLNLRAEGRMTAMKKRRSLPGVRERRQQAQGGRHLHHLRVAVSVAQNPV